MSAKVVSESCAEDCRRSDGKRQSDTLGSGLTHFKFEVSDENDNGGALRSFCLYTFRQAIDLLDFLVGRR